jgi:hypothetical protein
METSGVRLHTHTTTRFQREDAQVAPDSKGKKGEMMPLAKPLNDDRDLPIGVTL